VFLVIAHYFVMTQATEPRKDQSPKQAQNQAQNQASPISHQPPTSEALLQQLVEVSQRQNALLERIALAMEAAGDGGGASPNYEVCLTQFKSFDWGAIEAKVEQEDRDGVATVLWRGHRYVRRSAANKFEPAIWFSRSIGRDEEGNVQYAKLVTFRLRPKAEPLPSKVKEVQTSD
jgi:hypothetical protein